MGLPPVDPEHWYEPEAFDFSSSMDFLMRMAKEATHVLPFLQGVNIVRQWAGLYEMTPDHHHAIGPVDEVEDLGLQQVDLVMDSCSVLPWRSSLANG